jgi:hypothetical protein
MVVWPTSSSSSDRALRGVMLSNGQALSAGLYDVSGRDETCLGPAQMLCGLPGLLAMVCADDLPQLPGGQLVNGTLL